MREIIDIWKFQQALARRLLIWSVPSVLLGLFLLLLGDSFWQAFGIQAVAWGVIDALIALGGRWQSGRHRTALGVTPDPDRLRKEGAKLKRVLWINSGLDLLYIAAGIVLALVLGRGNPNWLGHGWGVIVQGTFLLVFDLIHAQSVPPTSLSAPLKVFDGPLHKPFFLPGGRAAALLVHGFPGSPAEMRPLAQSLQRRGWTVQGLLLPGFGPQLSKILDYGHGQWLEAVESALRELQKRHNPVLLVGYSMGGALAVSAASRKAPDGLVLLSPFWRLGSALQRLIGRLLRPFLPRYFRPLAKADFEDPNLRRSLREFFPQIDFADPAVIEELRNLEVPISVIHQVIRSGLGGYRRARAVDSATLVVQGSADELVRPSATMKLVRRLPAETNYLEVSSGHNLADPSEAGWEDLEEAVTSFAASVWEQSS